MIIYGVLGDVSILKLFTAGVLPGFLLAATFMAWVMLHSSLNPAMVPEAEARLSQVPWGERFVALKDLAPALFLIACAVGVGLHDLWPGLGSLGSWCGGITGAILTGVFAVEAIGGTPGALEGNFGQIMVQIEGIVATIVWSGGASALILFIIDKVIGLRVDKDEEAEGLDLSQHGEMMH